LVGEGSVMDAGLPGVQEKGWCVVGLGAL